MSIIELISLFGVMVVLAAMPSTSVALVVTRSATSGIGNGIAVAAGIVLGDLVFVMLAILGLSVVAETVGSLFMVIKYLGALYLLWLGFTLLTAKGTTSIAASNTGKEKGSFIASFLAGFVLTLGDIKAIFFYASLLPIFIDLSELRVADVLVIVCVTSAGVGGVKILYALSATKIASLARGLKFENAARKAAGGFMVGAGSYLIIKA
jgi:threonine/homoserine/homoserine lactone efflux protein